MSISIDLDHYAEGLVNLSEDVQVKLSKIHVINNKIRMITMHINRLVREYFNDNFTSEVKKIEHKIYIASLFAKSKRYADTKVILSNEMYALVKKNINRLDSYLARFSDEIKMQSIISNAPDHHSKESRFLRDQKKAQERERRQSRERENKQANDKREDKARGDHKDKRRNSQINELNERININNIPYTSKDNCFRIDSRLNNNHITEKRQSSASTILDVNKSSKGSNVVEKKSSSSVYKNEKATRNIKQNNQKSSKGSNVVEKKSSSSVYKNEKATRNFERNDQNSSSIHDNSSKGHSTRHDHNSKEQNCNPDHRDTKSSSSHSNSKIGASKSSSNASPASRHEANSLTDKKSTGQNTNELKKSKSSNSSRRKSSTSRSVDKSANVNVLKKADSSSNRLTSSNDPNLLSKSKCQKKIKDIKKRKYDEKNKTSDENQIDVNVKKRKLSKTNDENEFNIPVDPNEPTYCYCQDVSYGNMVACDNEQDCDIVWFHFGCVGLKSNPPGNWFCNECDKKRRNCGKSVR